MSGCDFQLKKFSVPIAVDLPTKIYEIRVGIRCDKCKKRFSAKYQPLGTRCDNCEKLCDPEYQHLRTRLLQSTGEKEFCECTEGYCECIRS